MRFQLRGVASLEALRPGDAVKLYLAIIQGLMAAGEAPFQWDDDRHLVAARQECVAALSTLLPRVGATLHLDVLDVLCRGFVFDLSLGGYGFVAGADVLLESANAQEWPPIQARLEAWLRPRPASGRAKSSALAWEEPEDMDTRFSDWGRREVLALQAGHLAKVDSTQAANAFMKQHGTPEQRVDAHLAEGDFDAATQLARTHFARLPGLVHGFADKLNAAGHWARARAWAEEHRMTRWLAQQSILRGEPDALPLNVVLFRAEPSAGQWFETLALAPGSERADLRAHLWRDLEARNAVAVQFDIRLGEGEVQAALDLWPRLSTWERQNRHDQLAAAAQTCEVDIAIALWSALAESLISRKSRDAYRLAAKALVQAKRALEKTGRGAEWPERGAVLRARYPMLRALKEELDRAKL